jgi:hypothetical protein
MSDLFDWNPPPGYPSEPGFKERSTSRDAARKMKPRAQTLRDQVLITLRTAWPGGMTADEIAKKMGKSILSVRPRVTELRKLEEIIPAKQAGGIKNQRRPNESGLDATVWVCRRPS